MKAKLYAAAAAISLALIPAGQALADEMIERQLNEDITVQGEAQGPGANVEINTDERGNTTVRAEAGVPSKGRLVIVDPAARTFQLEGNETIYVAPQTVPLEPMAGEEVTIHTKDGAVTLDAPKTGEKYEIEIDEDVIGDDEIEIERKPSDDLDGGVEIEVD